MVDVHLSGIIGFPNLKLYQPRDVFRITSDTLALANFIVVNPSDKKILDIGTGLCAIPIILCTKWNVDVVGVEIDSTMANLAWKSVCYNKLDQHIQVIHQDIKKYASECKINLYDIIVSNPPYYNTRCGYLNSNSTISNARHNVTLEIEDIISISSKLLKDKGKLVLVFTVERLLEVFSLYQQYHFAIKRVQFIYGGLDKNAKSFLIEGTKNGRSGMKVCPPLIL